MANPKHRMRPAPDRDTDALAATLKALADPFRLKLLDVLEEYGELSDGALYDRAEVEPLKGAYHIGVLRLAGIVRAHRMPDKQLGYGLTNHGRTVLGLARQMKRR